jgi:hypothetical protein
MGVNLPQNPNALRWHVGDDVTGGTCGLGPWRLRGPATCSPRCAPTCLSSYFRVWRIHVGSVPVLAQRLSYVGEYGSELAQLGRAGPAAV